MGKPGVKITLADSGKQKYLGAEYHPGDLLEHLLYKKPSWSDRYTAKLSNGICVLSCNKCKKELSCINPAASTKAHERSQGGCKAVATRSSPCKQPSRHASAYGESLRL
jgi:hypothetical protein